MSPGKRVKERNWSLAGFKALQAEAMRFKADRAVNEVRHLAEAFKSKRSRRETPSELLSNEDDIRAFLFRVNPATRLVKVRGKMVCLMAPAMRLLPRLPKTYGYKGGAARAALLAALGVKEVRSRLRDLDLVRFGKGDCRKDTELASTLMPEDAAHGHGVEICPNRAGYFSTRDLTVNEVCLYGERVLCTLDCLNDTIQGVLRPALHACDERGRAKPVTALKILRFFALARSRGDKAAYDGVPDRIPATRFEYLLQLRRAGEGGAAAKEIFQAECAKRGVSYKEDQPMKPGPAGRGRRVRF